MNCNEVVAVLRRTGKILCCFGEIHQISVVTLRSVEGVAASVDLARTPRLHERICSSRARAIEQWPRADRPRRLYAYSPTMRVRLSVSTTRAHWRFASGGLCAGTGSLVP